MIFNNNKKTSLLLKYLYLINALRFYFHLDIFIRQQLIRIEKASIKEKNYVLRILM